jgi:HTH-type transcriptional repressor of NAD biosynthesis genes
MKTGLIIGKFYPLHLGHIALINFGINQCDRLYVLICASDTENISGETRLKWVQNSYEHHPSVSPVLFNYSENELPNTSVSSKEIARLWAGKIMELLPPIDIIFSSELYGAFLAEYLHCVHKPFQPDRHSYPVSATDIRSDSIRFWDFIAPAARAFFVKKIIISGTESTGKSTLTERLAKYYETRMVPEIGRDIVPETEACTRDHLRLIATKHAHKIMTEQSHANKFLFIDTDINITRSYSRYLFNEELRVESWIENMNKGDLYLFLENDAPLIQDGTRLDQQRRDELATFHKNVLLEQGIHFISIKGSWEERFTAAVMQINSKWPKI